MKLWNEKNLNLFYFILDFAAIQTRVLTVFPSMDLSICLFLSDQGDKEDFSIISDSYNS